MAHCLNINRSIYCYLRALGSSFPKYCIQHMHDKSITLEVDTLDDFTSQLIHKKADKWSTQRNVKKMFNDTEVTLNKNFEHGNVRELSVERINHIFQELIEVSDNLAILDLMTQCISYRKCPSLSNLIYALAYCAQNGDKKKIMEIRRFCGEFYPDTLRVNSNFEHYVAEAVWIKGNVPESLAIFRKVYEDNPYLRRRIRLTFKYLVEDIVSNRSEATLINIIKFSQDLLKNYKDFFPLTCMWQVCFLSEWYTDQCLALDLLEENDGLLKAVLNRIPYVVSISLSYHRTEIVYRLLELLIKYEMKTQYSGVLLSLLDYQIRQTDTRSCLEIVRWSVKHNVDLPTIHHEKFLNLLLHHNIEVNKPKEMKTPKISSLIHTEPYAKDAAYIAADIDRTPK
ncbi:hypothetical protein NQ318_003953 [Aromia moschata]|uniref:Pentatricopeptide repeat-containing protein n=1 Tax=Aromia moschata TaxID=1265417 RepID=A0AAV8Z7F9_9CUCU|nr:hypothetical protein NQ318_003953 [Aromia moschata]